MKTAVLCAVLVSALSFPAVAADLPTKKGPPSAPIVKASMRTHKAKAHHHAMSMSKPQQSHEGLGKETNPKNDCHIEGSALVCK